MNVKYTNGRIEVSYGNGLDTYRERICPEHARAVIAQMHAALESAEHEHIEDKAKELHAVFAKQMFDTRPPWSRSRFRPVEWEELGERIKDGWRELARKVVSQ